MNATALFTRFLTHDLRHEMRAREMLRGPRIAATFAAALPALFIAQAGIAAESGTYETLYAAVVNYGLST